MAQKTAWDAAALTEADINLYLAGEGGQWTSWTPVISQVGSPTFTTNYSRFARYGRTIHWNFSLTLTGAGTSGTTVTVSVPVAAPSQVALSGSASIFDASTNTNWSGALNGLTTSTVRLVGDWSANGGWGLEPSLALAAGDVFYGSITYEAAS